MPKVSNGKRYCSYNAAQPAHAADRCAREILAILALFVVRARRLMGNPLGRNLSTHSCRAAPLLQIAGS